LGRYQQSCGEIGLNFVAAEFNLMSTRPDRYMLEIVQGSLIIGERSSV